MILGALVSAGVPSQELKRQLHLLDISNYEINFELVDRAGLGCSYARVQVADEHKHRHLADILKIIERSALSAEVKELVAKIFRRLAEAEAKVHNVSLEEVHFHEVGALDAIIDVVGAAIGFHLLKIERFVSSPLHVGSGTVQMAHGKFPVPPPAVAELVKGVPFYSSEIEGELLTPTGAAIITTVCSEFGPAPLMTLSATGYGAGSRQYQGFPNALRLMIGDDSAYAGHESETLVMIETNVDDMSPQILGHVMDRAFTLGALDCYFTPVQMKKNRLGVLLSILCDGDHKASLTDLLFAETTTLGVRSYEVERRALSRRMISVNTQYGPIDVKVAQLNGHIVKAMPEFAHCRSAAEKANVPLREVEDAARRALGDLKEI